MKRGRKPSGNINSPHIHTLRGLNSLDRTETLTVHYDVSPRAIGQEMMNRAARIQTMLDEQEQKYLLGDVKNLVLVPRGDERLTRVQRDRLEKELHTSIRRLKRIKSRDVAQESGLRLAEYRRHRLNGDVAHNGDPSPAKLVHLLAYIAGRTIDRRKAGRLLKLLPKRAD